MELEKYVTLITFIPWILIIIVSMLNNLNNENYQKFSLKYLGRNIFRIFRLDTLLLIICFWYFASFNKEFVDKYLFAIMCLYLFVSFFYENRASFKKNFWKDNFIQIILLIIINSIPFIYYSQTNNLIVTYKIMLLYLFFEYIIILIVSYITILIKMIFRKKDSEFK